MTTLQHVTPDVDALDIDAPAAAQLDIDAQRAGFDGLYRIVRPTGGPTMIRFTSRRAFQDAADYGLIHIGNPHLITAGALEVHVPVTFGHPYAWNAWATYPVQDVCECRADRVHMAGCPADEVQVVVVDIPGIPAITLGGDDDDRLRAIDEHLAGLSRGSMHRMAGQKRGSVCGRFTSHTDSLTDRDDQTTCADCLVKLDLPRRIPGLRLDAVTPYGDDHRELAEAWRAAVSE